MPKDPFLHKGSAQAPEQQKVNAAQLPTMAIAIFVIVAMAIVTVVAEYYGWLS